MKILITGANGLVGSHLIRRLDSLHQLTGISRRKRSGLGTKKAAFVELDMTSMDELNSFLMKSEYDVIINCAAMADVDLCEREKEAAFAINCKAVETIANYCKTNRALLIQISTDYIFDGNAGPYDEADLPNPINHYGRTKLASEQYIQNSKCEYIIVRAVHIYGNLPDMPSKQLAWLLTAKNNGEEIKGAVDQYSNPTWAGNLADAIIELIGSSFRGIIHIGGNDYISRYEFAVEASKVMGFERNLIRKMSMSELKLSANRPLKAGLKIEKMKSLLKTRPFGVKEGILKVHTGAR